MAAPLAHKGLVVEVLRIPVPCALLAGVEGFTAFASMGLVLVMHYFSVSFQGDLVL